MDINLKEVIGLGVAGNFANHLKQAGEMKDFENVEVEEESAPKGIFPFYLPKSESFLNVFPISTTKQELPSYEANAQVEPEVAILCELTYENEKVLSLSPKYFAAFNDCTIRKEGAKKISEKKNWCAASKGLGDKWIEIDTFREGGVMDAYRLASFVTRDGVRHAYGEDSPLLGYSYFYEKLEKWLLLKLNEQQDFGPLENISQYLKESAFPKYALISIGATAYAEFGEKNYLKKGDKIEVIVYHGDKEQASASPSAYKSVLVQEVC